MGRTKAPRDPIDTMCPWVPVPPHLPAVLPWPSLSPLSQSFLHPTYYSFLTCASHCCSITWVPQPHHDPVPTLAMQRWRWAGLIPQQWVQPQLGQHLQHHHYVLQARTLVSRKARALATGVLLAHGESQDQGIIWGCQGPHHPTGTQVSKRPTDLWGPQGPCHVGRPPHSWGTQLCSSFLTVHLFIEKLDIAKKKGILVNTELNNVSVCHIQYIFKLTHCIQ